MTMMSAPRLVALMAGAAMLALSAGQVDAGGKAERAKTEVSQSQKGGAAKADKKADRKADKKAGKKAGGGKKADRKAGKTAKSAKVARLTSATLPEDDIPEIAIEDDMVYPGGSADFDETCGCYRDASGEPIDGEIAVDPMDETVAVDPIDEVIDGPIDWIEDDFGTLPDGGEGEEEGVVTIQPVDLPEGTVMEDGTVALTSVDPARGGAGLAARPESAFRDVNDACDIPWHKRRFGSVCR